MKRTVINLADGRELIYFDESDAADRSALDARALPPRPPAAELRYDEIAGEWVTVTAHRQDRTFLPPTDACPLCPSTAGFASEIPAADYDVVVFENRFPAFAGPGRCEVIAFTSAHDGSFAGLSAQRVRTVLDAWADRTAELSELPGVEQVYCFENRGEAIGVTLHHPHGQIYAYPFVPPVIQRALTSAARYAEQHRGASLFAAQLAREQAAAERIVARNEHWTAFVPWAARWPYEVHLYPHRRLPDLPALDDAERDAFGELYLKLLRACDALFAAPLPYISAWHQAPVRSGRSLGYLHLELFSLQRDARKLKYLAGSESGMGAFLNDVAPEVAAARLRELIP